LHFTNAKERLSCFKRAVKEAKLPLAPEYVKETTFDKHGGYAKTLILLRLIPRPTGIFAANDMIALGILLAIREAGLHCPLSAGYFDHGLWRSRSGRDYKSRTLIGVSIGIPVGHNRQTDFV
jgi:DNA-binding LacI/PurR family transcriptional regulator